MRCNCRWNSNIISVSSLETLVSDPVQTKVLASAKQRYSSSRQNVDAMHLWREIIGCEDRHASDNSEPVRIMGLYIGKTPQKKNPG
jgi:hypothetical protein